MPAAEKKGMETGGVSEERKNILSLGKKMWEGRVESGIETFPMCRNRVVVLNEGARLGIKRRLLWQPTGDSACE